MEPNSTLPLYYQHLQEAYDGSSKEYLQSIENLLKIFTKDEKQQHVVIYKLSSYKRYLIHSLTDFYNITSMTMKKSFYSSSTKLKDIKLIKTKTTKLPSYTLSEIMNDSDKLKEIKQQITWNKLPRVVKNKYRSIKTKELQDEFWKHLIKK